MPLLSDQLLKRRQIVSAARWDEVDDRLRSLAEWLLSNPTTSKVLRELEIVAPAQAVLGRRKPNMPPPAATPEEIASIGVEILRQVRGGHDTFTYVADLGVRPPYGSSSSQDYINEALERFVLPALDHVLEQVQIIEAGGTPEAVVESRMDELLTDDFRALCPETTARLTKVAATIARDDSSTDWPGTANSCRQAMIDCVRELQRAAPSPVSGIRQADVKGYASAIVGALAAEGRPAETLAGLVAAAWDHAQAVTHWKSAQRSDAQRLYALTALAILELWHIVRTLPVRPGQSA